jgi:uncharacterized protein YjdB
MRKYILLGFAAALASCVGSDGYGSSTTVTSPGIEAIKVEITPANAALQVGEAVRLTATVTGGPTSASRAVTFTSSKDGIVVVEALANEMAKVTAVAKGNVTVIATSVANPQKSAGSAIIVAP